MCIVDSGPGLHVKLLWVFSCSALWQGIKEGCLYVIVKHCSCCGDLQGLKA
jgi:hypothetical protein